MTEQIITFIVGALSAMITAILTYYVSLRTNKKATQHEIITEQKYHYFLPFKYQAQELLNRVRHIEKRLSEDQPAMKTYFSVSFENKKLEWFFKDWIDYEKLEPGGYFLASTIYMNCLLYYRMKVMQDKFPYIIANVVDSLEEVSASTDLKLKNFISELVKDSSLHASDDYKEWLKYKGELNLTKIVSAIRVSTIMRKGEGIPFALHYSFGDFISKEDGVLNYEEFCSQLIDENQRMKFYPLINFWLTLVDDEGNINMPKLNKLRALILSLKLIDSVKLK